MKFGFLAAALAVAVSASAQTSVEDDTLRHVNEIARELIAPCCWSQTADGHQSDAAKTIKAEIREGLRNGLSDERIVEKFVVQYGERIRAVPKAEGFNRTLSLSIGLVAFAGAIIVVLYLRRMIQTLPALPIVDWRLKEKIEKDLQRTDS